MNTYFPAVQRRFGQRKSSPVQSTTSTRFAARSATLSTGLSQISVALYKFGQDTEVMFASHSWPRWGNDRIREVLRAQRDAYANLNNQTLQTT